MTKFLSPNSSSTVADGKVHPSHAFCALTDAIRSPPTAEEPFDAEAFQAQLDLSYGLTYRLTERIFPSAPGSKLSGPSPTINGRASALPFEIRQERCLSLLFYQAISVERSYRLGVGAIPKETKPKNEAEKRLERKLHPAKAAARKKLEAEEAATKEVKKSLVDYGSEEDELDSRSKAFASTSKATTASQPAPLAAVVQEGTTEAEGKKKKRKRKREGSASASIESSVTAPPAEAPSSDAPRPGGIPYAPNVSPTASADEGIDLGPPVDVTDSEGENDDTPSVSVSPSKEASPSNADRQAERKRKKREKKKRKKAEKEAATLAAASAGPKV